MTKTIRATYHRDGSLLLHSRSDLEAGFGVVVLPGAEIELTISEVHILPSQVDYQIRQPIEQRRRGAFEQQDGYGSTRRRSIESNPAWFWLIGLAVLAVLLILGYLDYTAYMERFPSAAPWTYFFQRGCN